MADRVQGIGSMVFGSLTPFSTRVLIKLDLRVITKIQDWNISDCLFKAAFSKPIRARVFVGDDENDNIWVCPNAGFLRIDDPTVDFLDRFGFALGSVWDRFRIDLGWVSDWFGVDFPLLYYILYILFIPSLFFSYIYIHIYIVYTLFGVSFGVI